MKKIIINFNPDRLRAAVLEDGHLVEFHVEKPSKELVGNIYVGKVVNVLPGMQAAFVDIGIERNAFLYIGDALPIKEDETEREEINISEVLQQGQTILVQVKKEAFGNKGPRVTTHISIPGRFIVYMPESKYIGVSKKITDEVDRSKLKSLGESLVRDNEGMIIRTKTFEVDIEQINDDLNFLRGIWDSIYEQSKNKPIPSLIYKDLDLIARLIRDIFTEDVEQLIIDNEYEYAKVSEIIKMTVPEYSDRLEVYQGEEDIFSAFDIQHEIDKALRRKVWLKSGGYLVIDKTEALTVIDVNTGKYIGHSRLEDTVFKINTDAAVEIAKQLRLRDIGGIIVIDFIDMEIEEHAKEIVNVLEIELKRDRTKSSVLGFTQLGLVEMTRKKVRRSLDNILLRTCPMCEGEGKVNSEEEIFNNIKREATTFREFTFSGNVILEIHPFNAALLNRNEEELLKKLIEISEKEIQIKENYFINLNSYKFQYKVK
ncbi:MAG: ribonuclease E/G [Vulcanibacillus sp.]